MKKNKAQSSINKNHFDSYWNKNLKIKNLKINRGAALIQLKKQIKTLIK